MTETFTLEANLSCYFVCTWGLDGDSNPGWPSPLPQPSPLAVFWGTRLAEFSPRHFLTVWSCPLWASVSNLCKIEVVTVWYEDLTDAGWGAVSM